LGQILALTVVMQLATLVSPLFLQFAVDNIIPAGDFNILFALAFGFLIVAATAVAAALVRGYLITNLGQLLSYQFIVNLSRHLFKLPLSWFEKRQVGDLLSRLESTHPISEFLSRNLIAALVDGIMTITTLIVMFLYSPLLSFLAMSALGVYAAVRLGLLPSYNRLNEEALAARGREHGMMIENLSGMASIKAFSQENERLSLWVSRKADAVNRIAAVARIQSIWDQLDTTVRTLEAVAFVTVAIWLAMTGSLSLGMLFAFAAYKQQFLTASFNLVLMFSTFRTLDVHLQRISEVALASPEALHDRDFLERPPVSGRLELSKVSYSYGSGEPRILDHLDLSVAPGETVAIMGRSGQGKTTLLKLMLGLLEPDTGTIAVDGIALDQFGHRSWRRQVGYVAQDDALYSGSIAQNIAFFDPNQDMERVLAAARQAAIHDDIIAMPMQYQSLVGDMGSTLSGGQKARVLIARALYRQPRVLLVDEGSAHLDLETEKTLNEAISALGITRILVSHRPETIERADRVLELRDGRIVAEKAGRSRARAGSAAHPALDQGAEGGAA
jgi:ATP-binding cassette subfamily B protein RaxB